ncbi:hypothetical protein Cfla_3267 [Cellulomonas flavigena DSM 20109]|uniref:Uncharacterized protein n=1 Tax=Cellulomonas flavigena (strain ATCC 482 / DSM 20109 / BCRC 11376 / JCM 18109 / NBRC 3775 / NCIMB 8073 / NRS 134) TaxID=446466 RepID=D5UBY9_CELFN|nr:hypothetical protein [Cellulomonas flavigena]ADG76148.1 hypothetical protein Cfla_3267 [Cellulomonas flavigena DSM 20109]
MLAAAAALGANEGGAVALSLAASVLFLGSVWTAISGRRFAFLRSRTHGLLGILVAVAFMSVAGAFLPPPDTVSPTDAPQPSVVTTSAPPGPDTPGS